MQASPCLNPRKVYNATLGRFMQVPCGHCDACLVNKGRSRTDRINDVFLKYPCRFFVTLTYANWRLPIARYDECLDGYTSPMDCDYNGEVYTLPVHKIKYWNNEPFVKKCHKLYGGIPVLCHRDIINFQKRFRKNFSKLNNNEYKEIFIHHCGEYGPTGFRPHFHLLFGFRQDVPMSLFERCVRASWSSDFKTSSGVVRRIFGRTDVQRNYDKGTAKYVAQYLNCTTHLPFVYSKSVFRPFCSRTKYPVSEFTEREFFDRLPTSYTVHRTESGKFDTLPITPSRYGFIFPRYGGFLRLPVFARIELFEFSKRFLAASSGAVAARRFIEIEKIRSNFQKRLFDNLPSFIRRSPAESVAIQCLRQLYNYQFEDSELRLTNFFQVCRKHAKIIASLNISPREYFEREDQYRSKLELFKLKSMYNEFEQLTSKSLRPLELREIRSYYLHTCCEDCKQSVLNQYNQQFNVSDIHPVRFPSSQFDYAAKCHQILLDTTKTKKRNDDFEKRGIKRKTWIPFISKRINSFINV